MTILVRIGRALTIIGQANGVELGASASFVFRAVGGIDPMTLEVTAETFGPEWTFDDSVAGQITLSTADASVPGMFTFTLRANDAVREPVEREFSVNVAAEPLVLSGTFIEANQGSAYSDSITASGGITPYTWAVISGSLPPGLSLDSSTGVLSGIPTSPGSPSLFDFTVRVTDSSGVIATSDQRMNVTPPLADPDAVEVLASLVDVWDLQGASDLSSEINGYAMVASGTGDQNVTSEIGPNGLANNAISIGGSTSNVLGMAADNAAFDIADDDAWWAAAIYLVSTSGTIVMWGKTPSWRLVRSGGIIYSQSPSTLSATGPTLGTGVWKIAIGWRNATTNKVYLDIDGTVYESPGTGTPGDNINPVRVEGGATMRYARIMFGKGAYLGASARAYLQNGNAGRLYSEILSDAGL